MANEATPEIEIRAEIGRTAEDVGLLLEFLGERADSRLQAHFEDTRGELSAPARKLAAPPCRTYRHFLSRFTAIEDRLRCPGAAMDAPATLGSSPTEGDEQLTDRAFLYFSRDFLAAVAAPATVESIRVTRAYIAARRCSLLSRLWQRPSRRGSPALASLSDGDCARSARRLASRVVLTEWFALGGTALTLVISAYAFSGHRILESQSQISAEYAAIGHDKEELAKEMPAAWELGSTAALTALCRRAADPPGPALKEAAAAAAVDPPATLGAAGPPPISPQQTATRLRECELYWRTNQNNANIVGVKMHMESWSQVVIAHPWAGEVFGIDPALIGASAQTHPEYCQALGLPEEANCASALPRYLYTSREVADSLLGSIALYILPTLYGGLGAMAATLRGLRRRVDQWLVTVTDRGRVQQDVILGVLCGAIIGLFFGYLGKASPEAGLGLSALALLAGYNVSGVFAFLDELSNRVFQPTHGQSDPRPS